MAGTSSTPRRESDAEAPDVRQRILDTASTLFHERGVRGAFVSTSMLTPDEATRILLASARSLLAPASR